MASNTRAKSQTKRQQSPAKKIMEKNTNLSDEEIVNETYGNSNKQYIDSASKHKKQKQDNDNTTTASPPSDTQIINVNAMDLDPQNETSTPKNSHALSSEDDLTSREDASSHPYVPITDKDDQMDTDDLLNKETVSQNQQNTGSASITSPSHNTKLDIFSNATSHADSTYKIFFDKKDFDPKKSANEVLTDIKQAFFNTTGMVRAMLHRRMNLQYYTVQFTNEETFNKVLNQPITALNNIKAVRFSTDLIQSKINGQLDNLSNSTVLVANVPINYNTDLVLKHMANFTSTSITSHKEIRPSRKLNRRSRPLSNPPQYKKIFITFAKSSAVNYLLSQDKWGILIEDFLVRVIPVDDNNPTMKTRTTPTYTVTGIPLNATVLDLLPLVDHVKGKSLSFVPTKRTALHKVAHIYTEIPLDSTEGLLQHFNTDFKGFNLQIYPRFNYMNTCGNCGINTHQTHECTDDNYRINPKTKVKEFIKKLIKRPDAFQDDDDTTRFKFDRLKILTRPSPRPERQSSTTKRSRPQVIPRNVQPHSNPNNTQKQTPTPSNNDTTTMVHKDHFNQVVNDLQSQITVLSKKLTTQDNTLQDLTQRLTKTDKLMEQISSNQTLLHKKLETQSSQIDNIPKILDLLTTAQNNGVFDPRPSSFKYQEPYTPETNIFPSSYDDNSYYASSQEEYASDHTVEELIHPDNPATSSSSPATTKKGFWSLGM